MERCRTIEQKVLEALYSVEKVYYPLLAAVGVPANLVTIVILSLGKCGLSKCVTRYLVAMAMADLLVVIIDLILRHIPVVFWLQFTFLWNVPLCNIHAVLLYSVTDCSVWFTVSFTFDRFVAICSQKLKMKYCTERTAAVILGTVTVLSCLKNIFWYFLYTGRYLLINYPWFCLIPSNSLFSQVWIIIEFLHYVINPLVPFGLVLLFNVLTVRHIFVVSRTRQRLQGHGKVAARPCDPELDSRRKSMILLFVISGNFILLWAVFLIYSVWRRIWYLGVRTVRMKELIREIGFMLQLLSCCTNTYIYAMTQTKFRAQFHNGLKYPFILLIKIFKQ